MYAISINFAMHMKHTQVTGIFRSMFEDNFIITCEETQDIRILPHHIPEEKKPCTEMFIEAQLFV
jgi:hypothetical protein